MTRAPKCRWCGRTDGELVAVAMPAGALDGMTTSRRSSVARLARLQPVVEHPACAADEQAATAAANAERARLHDLARAAVRAGDAARAAELIDAAADVTTAPYRNRSTQPERTTAP